MRLEHLHLVHFKNHAGADLNLGPQVNCFLGDNGSGKTNVLDAVHYLCFCKSYFNPIDAQNIAHGEPFMLVQGDFERLEVKERVICGAQRGAKLDPRSQFLIRLLTLWATLGVILGALAAYGSDFGGTLGVFLNLFGFSLGIRG